LFSLSLGAAPVVVIRSWALRHERRHAPAAPSRDATDTPPPLGHIRDSNRRALPPPKPAEQHFQTWISKLMVAAGDDPDRTGRPWGALLWFLFWSLNPAYPGGSLFESGYIEKYSGWRIAKYIQFAIGFGALAFGSFFDGLTHKPRGTGEVLEMTVGTGAFLLPFGFLVFLTNRAVKRRNPNRAAPAGWYPDPLGIRRLRYFDGTDWTDKGQGPYLQRDRAATTQPPSSPAGWYPDPAGNGRLRYFDGNVWTDNYSEQPASP
jgi:hypothetical protein